MLESLQAYHDWGLLALRVVVAIIFIYHAWPKLKMPEAMAQGMNWSKGAVRLLGLVEMLGALGVGLGINTQWAALLLGLVMIGAIKYKFLKWHTPFSAHDKMGWEFDLILLASALFILLHGAGEFALGM